ncbi:hypothetical protein ACU4HD_46960 [Cupriavidus basilensis]
MRRTARRLHDEYDLRNPTTATAESAPARQQSPSAARGARISSPPGSAIFGLVVVVVLILAALAAPSTTPQNPHDLMQPRRGRCASPPGSPAALGNGHRHWSRPDGPGAAISTPVASFPLWLRASACMWIGSAAVAAW